MGNARKERRRSERLQRRYTRKTETATIRPEDVPKGAWMEPETARAIAAGTFIVAKPLKTPVGGMSRKMRARLARMNRLRRLGPRAAEPTS